MRTPTCALLNHFLQALLCEPVPLVRQDVLVHAEGSLHVNAGSRTVVEHGHMPFRKVVPPSSAPESTPAMILMWSNPELFFSTLSFFSPLAPCRPCQGSWPACPGCLPSAAWHWAISQIGPQKRANNYT